MSQYKFPITPEADDKLYERAMFSLGGQANYLGNPSVVGKLVAGFCHKVRDALEHRAAGTLHAEGFIAEIEAERDRYAAIFHGEDPAYTPVAGWNSVTLPIRLKVDLGPYWQQNRDENDGDPLKCFFSWLCWAVFDAVKKANGDPDLEMVILSERTHSAVRLLLGSRQNT